jgi:hypothetical protein
MHPRRERLSIVEPLKLLRVNRCGARLWLAVVDQSRRKHLITLRFGTATAARAHVGPMREWIASQAPLAYVRRRGEGALIDIDAPLARAIA